MILPIREIENAGDWSDMKIALGALLGLDDAVSDQVLARARADDHFAGYLLRTRGHDQLLKKLMTSQKTMQYSVSIPLPEENHSAKSLLKKVGIATWRWAASGFKRTAPEQLKVRLDACFNCPELRSPPKSMLYKVAMVASSDPRICNRCGCMASRKAIMATENCPVEDDFRPGLSLWGEALSTD